MKKLFTLALIAIATSASAEDYKYLNLGYGSEVKSITLETIQKITFQNGNVVVTTSEGNQTFPLAEMQYMNFTNTETAVEKLETTENTDAVLYDISGRRVTTPQKGLYIRNGKKVVVK